MRRVHQLVWECVNGKIPPGHEINHKNGIKTDNRIVNLEAVDRTANMRHAYDTGLNKAYCEGNGMATLTNDQAKAIRESEAPTIELAATYGVSKASVNRIRAGATWRRLS